MSLYAEASKDAGSCPLCCFWGWFNLRPSVNITGYILLTTDENEMASHQDGRPFSIFILPESAAAHHGLRHFHIISCHECEAVTLIWEQLVFSVNIWWEGKHFIASKSKQNRCDPWAKKLFGFYDVKKSFTCEIIFLLIKIWTNIVAELWNTWFWLVIYHHSAVNYVLYNDALLFLIFYVTS